MDESVRTKFKDAINAVQEQLLVRVREELEKLAEQQGGKITPAEAVETLRREMTVPWPKESTDG